MSGVDPPDVITGRDVELLAAGLVCSGLAAAGVLDETIDLVFPAVFLLLGLLSFGLAWWDIRTRGGLSVPRKE